MLAKLSAQLPDGDDWLFEPKWDGFRTLVFRDGDEVYLQSRDRRPSARACRRARCSTARS
jgi:ATP-dependent DNA ligase